MLRRYEKLYSPALGKDMEMLVFGHFGNPMIAFPSGGGKFHDFEDNGMVSTVAHLIEAGKLKLYCPDGIDHESWLNDGVDPHWQGFRHNAYQDYLTKDVVPFIRHDCQDDGISVALAGCSLGAYHAANFGLKFPHLFPYALCMSGRYDLEKITSPSGSEEVYFNNPMAYIANMYGNELEHVRYNAHIVLVCGQGAFEDKCLEETHRLANLLREKGISHELDIWGHDVEHHWYWWRKQFPHHVSKAVA